MITDRLSFIESKELIQDLDLDVGQQVKKHHCKEGHGNDRCYIKRVEDGYILFCHHCSKRGFVSNRNFSTSCYPVTSSHFGKRSTRDASYGHGTNVGDGTGRVCKDPVAYLPRDSVNGIKRWSNTQAKVWILSYGISSEAINDSGICWSDSFSSILFPYYCDGQLVSWQARKFPEEKPKYRTYGDSQAVYDALETPRITHGDALGATQRVVLVEDYLSALKVSSVAAAFPLRGTSLKDSQLLHLLKRYDEFVIMLDNDNWQVKSNQTKLYKRLSMYTRKVSVVQIHKDPKEHSLEEIQGLL